MNSTPGNFWAWMAELGSGERTAVMVLCVIGSVIILMTLFVTVYKMHKNRLEDSLKRELLDRGMSADEIATVVRAKPIRRIGGCSSLTSANRSNLS
jgi:hypothetical protein